MASPYIKRLEKLQQALAAQLSKPVASRFLPFDPDHTVEDYDRLAEEECDKMIADGEIRENQRGRVKFIRWLTAEEHAELRQAQADGPEPSQAQVAVSRPATSTAVQDHSSDPVPDGSPSGERSVRGFDRPLDVPDLGII